MISMGGVPVFLTSDIGPLTSDIRPLSSGTVGCFNQVSGLSDLRPPTSDLCLFTAFYVNKTYGGTGYE